VGWCLFQVGAREVWKLVLPMNVIFKIYIKKCFLVFSHLDFHIKLLCTMYMWSYVDDILNAIICDKLLIT
jgi:hypothetical protein